MREMEYKRVRVGAVVRAKARPQLAAAYDAGTMPALLPGGAS